MVGTVPGGVSGRGTLRIVVTSEQTLSSEAVSTALAERGDLVESLAWSAQPGGFPPRPRTAYDVGLLISELDRWRRLGEAGRVMASLPIPWVVLTSAPYGPLWGAMIDFGARVVLSEQTPLDSVYDVLGAVARGRTPLPPDEARRLRAGWSHLWQEHQRLRGRLGQLTPREREVLQMLYSGDSVAHIADALGLSPATVRGYVKAVQRKMRVHSQLAAVASLRRLEEITGEAPLLQS